VSPVGRDDWLETAVVGPTATSGSLVKRSSGRLSAELRLSSLTSADGLDPAPHGRSVRGQFADVKQQSRFSWLPTKPALTCRFTFVAGARLRRRAPRRHTRGAGLDPRRQDLRRLSEDIWCNPASAPLGGRWAAFSSSRRHEGLSRGCDTSEKITWNRSRSKIQRRLRHHRACERSPPPTNKVACPTRPDDPAVSACSLMAKESTQASTSQVVAILAVGIVLSRRARRKAMLATITPATQEGWLGTSSGR
jgi:hypothetical protein